MDELDLETLSSLLEDGRITQDTYDTLAPSYMPAATQVPAPDTSSVAAALAPEVSLEEAPSIVDTEGLASVIPEATPTFVPEVPQGVAPKSVDLSPEIAAEEAPVDEKPPVISSDERANLANSISNIIAGADKLPSEPEVPQIETTETKVETPAGKEVSYSTMAYEPPPEGLNRLIDITAEKYGVNPETIKRMAFKESTYNQDAISPVGAIGIMQLMPGTAKDMGVDPTDIRQNVEGGVKYFKQMLDRYDGDEAKALAAYNAGPGRFDQSTKKGTPLPVETQNYVRDITGQPISKEAANQVVATQKNQQQVIEQARLDQETMDANSALKAQREQEKLDKQEAYYTAQTNKMNRELEELNNMDVNDRNRFWSDRDTATNIAGAFALIAGAFGSAATGKENVALKLIEAAIDKDVASQLKEYEVRKDKLKSRSDLLKTTIDTDSTMAQRRATAEQLAWTNVLNSQNLYSAKLGNEKTKLDMQKTKEEIQEKVREATIKRNEANQLAALSKSNNVDWNKVTPTKETEKFFVQGVGMANSEKNKDKVEEAKVAFDDLMNTVTRLDGLITTYGTEVWNQTARNEAAALQTLLTGQIKEAFKLGALDKGTEAFVGKLVRENPLSMDYNPFVNVAEVQVKELGKSLIDSYNNKLKTYMRPGFSPYSTDQEAAEASVKVKGQL